MTSKLSREVTSWRTDPLPPPLPPSENERTTVYIGLGFAALSVLMWLFSGTLVGGFRDFDHYGHAARIGAAVGSLIWLVAAAKALHRFRLRTIDVMQFSLIVGVALLFIPDGARVALLANQALDSSPCQPHDAFVMAPAMSKTSSLPDDYAVIVDAFDDPADVAAALIPGEASNRYTACVAPGALGSPWVVSLQLK